MFYLADFVTMYNGQTEQVSITDLGAHLESIRSFYFMIW